MRRVADSRNMSQKDAWSALILWFIKQEEEVQSLILGGLPERIEAYDVQAGSWWTFSK